MDIEIEGFDEIIEELKQLKQKESLEEIVTFGKLFPSDFMEKYTDFESIDDFFHQSNWDVRSYEDFSKIPESELNEYIQNNSDFSTWQEMLNKAALVWIEEQIRF